MKLKTYTAGSMSQALAMVKRELGAGAVILHTRTYKRGGILGLGAKPVVEITAADGAELSPARRTRGRAAPPTPTPLPRPEPPMPTAGDLIKRTYQAARAELQQAQPGPIASQLASLTPPVHALGGSPSQHHEQLAEEMRTVKRMVGRMMREQKARSSRRDVPDKLFDRYLMLLEQEVAEELADEVVQQVRDSLTSDQITNDEHVTAALRDALAKLVPMNVDADEVSRSPDGRPRTVALIGPTGVGKTTTIAKLAANLKLKQKKNVGLITLDTYRIAAVDQLRTYANIIGVPLHVVVQPEELTNALRQMSRCDAVLIDTAGRSQKDDPKLDQLAGFIRVADPHEVHLVLSSTCTQKVMLDTVERFNRVRTDRIIFTKLDEAVSFGVLLNVARKVNKRLSYLTTGQDVPHHIEPGRSDRLASLVLGGEI